MIVFEKDIRQKIETDFDESAHEAMVLLQEAISEQEALKSSRIIRCIVYLSEGSLSGLKESVSMAMDDPRDVMMCAEYEYDPDSNSESRVRDFSKSFSDT